MTRVYDWKEDLTDAEIAAVRRRNLADLAASLRDACDELHKLLSEPRPDYFEVAKELTDGGFTVPAPVSTIGRRD